jgi:plasmid stabilization system protein ParE
VAELRYARRALASLRRQDAFLRERNPTAADAVLAEIEQLCGLIADFPDMGRQIEGTGLRYHISRKYRYRIIYRITAGQVEVLDILHPRQK